MIPNPKPCRGYINGQWSAEHYVKDCGWTRGDIELAVSRGIPLVNARELTNEQIHLLHRYCGKRATEYRREDWKACHPEGDLVYDGYPYIPDAYALARKGTL